MKRILPVLFAFFFSSALLAQSKMEFGLTVAFSKFMPEAKSVFQAPIEDVYGEGIGIYGQKNIYKKLSLDIALMFNYKELNIAAINENSFREYGYGEYGYGGSGGYYYDIGSSYNYSTNSLDTDSYPLRYLTLPFHLNYNFHKGLFLQGGAEVFWLINNEAIKERTELFGSIGLGYQKSKFKLSLNYLQGFKDSNLENENYGIVTVFRNRAVQLNLSYPLWQKM